MPEWHDACLPTREMTPILAHRAILALGLAFGLAACGGGDSLPAAGSEAPAAPGPAPTPSPAPTPTPPPPLDRFGGVPVFPGSRVVHIDLEGDEWDATYVSDATLGEVRDFYDRALPDDGWRIEDRDAKAGGVDYDVRRGDDEGQVRLRARDDGTEIRIAVERD